MSSLEPFANVARLRSLRRTLSDLDPARPPMLRWILPPPEECRGLALLPGSFNPPTNAHLALADAARRVAGVGWIGYLLATRTVNKERIEGADLADRLLLLESIARDRTDEGVVVVNRGLYVDQARIIRSARPSLQELTFVVGFDKIVQIFDPRYYDDSTVALATLFDLASFLVAPRDGAGPDELRSLLAEPRVRRYAGHVRALPLAPVHQDQSSSRVRDQLARGEEAADVPSIVNGFQAATGAYEATGERYAARRRILDAIASPAFSSSDDEQIAHALRHPTAGAAEEVFRRLAPLPGQESSRHIVRLEPSE